MLIEEVVNNVADVAKKVAKRKMQKFPEAASFGDAIRQGDVYLTLLEKVPNKTKSIKTVAKLAPGNTQGSRHILDSVDGVSSFAFENANEFDGPILQLSCERILTHPEHGNWILSPGIYGVSYQRTQDAVDKAARRVLD